MRRRREFQEEPYIVVERHEDSGVGPFVLGALIGAGGLGALVFQGLSSSALDLVLLGVVPVVAMAAAFDAIFRFVAGVLTP